MRKMTSGNIFQHIYLRIRKNMDRRGTSGKIGIIDEKYIHIYLTN